MSPTPPLSSTGTPRGFAWAIVLAVLALVPVVLWPGDVSFLIDEPRLLAMAWHANHDGTLASVGLAGNFGVRYGPLGVQIYQVLLLITHDPYLLVILRGLLCGGATAVGLLWLARTLRLPAWFAAAVLVAPLVVTYQRVLWDASFAIPVGTLAVAALADFVATGRVWSLRGCVVATVLVPLIHPQGLPLFLPIAGWLAWRQRDALRRDRSALLIIAALLLACNAVYFVRAAGDVWWRLHHTPSATYPGKGSHALSLLAPFLGGNLLAGYAAVRPAWLGPIATACLWVSRIIYPLAWLGIALAIPRTLSTLRAWLSSSGSGPTSLLIGTPPAGQGTTPRDTVMTIALTGLVLQGLLFGALRIPCAPQYFFGTFPFHVLVAWSAIDALRRWHLGAPLGIAYAIGGTLITLGTALAIHLHGYELLGWPTLRDSVEVARDLNNFSDAEVRTEIPFYAKHPQSLRALRLLYPALPGASPHSRSGLWITDPPHIDGHFLNPALEYGPGLPSEPAPLIDVTPLPRDWIPAPDTW